MDEDPGFQFSIDPLGDGLGCQGCDKLQKLVDKHQEEKQVNYKTLKQKIVSTDQLIKRFRSKCEEYDQQSKMLEDVTRKLERSKRNTETVNSQLQTSLQQLEPLKKQAENLTTSLRRKDSTIQTLEDKLQAAEKLRAQFEAASRVHDSEKLKMGKEEKERKALTKKIDSLEALKLKHEKEITTLKESNKNLKNENKTLEKKLEKASQMNSGYLSDVHSKPKKSSKKSNTKNKTLLTVDDVSTNKNIPFTSSDNTDNELNEPVGFMEQDSSSEEEIDLDHDFAISPLTVLLSPLPPTPQTFNSTDEDDWDDGFGTNDVENLSDSETEENASKNIGSLEAERTEHPQDPSSDTNSSKIIDTPGGNLDVERMEHPPETDHGSTIQFKPDDKKISIYGEPDSSPSSTQKDEIIYDLPSTSRLTTQCSSQQNECLNIPKDDTSNHINKTEIYENSMKQDKEDSEQDIHVKPLKDVLTTSSNHIDIDGQSDFKKCTVSDASVMNKNFNSESLLESNVSDVKNSSISFIDRKSLVLSETMKQTSYTNEHNLSCDIIDSSPVNDDKNTMNSPTDIQSSVISSNMKLSSEFDNTSKVNEVNNMNSVKNVSLVQSDLHNSEHAVNPALNNKIINSSEIKSNITKKMSAEADKTNVTIESVPKAALIDTTVTATPPGINNPDPSTSEHSTSSSLEPSNAFTTFPTTISNRISAPATNSISDSRSITKPVSNIISAPASNTTSSLEPSTDSVSELISAKKPSNITGLTPDSYSLPFPESSARSAKATSPMSTPNPGSVFVAETSNRSAKDTYPTSTTEPRSTPVAETSIISAKDIYPTSAPKPKSTSVAETSIISAKDIIPTSSPEGRATPVAETSISAKDTNPTSNSEPRSTSVAETSIISAKEIKLTSAPESKSTSVAETSIISAKDIIPTSSPDGRVSPVAETSISAKDCNPTCIPEPKPTSVAETNTKPAKDINSTSTPERRSISVPGTNTRIAKDVAPSYILESRSTSAAETNTRSAKGSIATSATEPRFSLTETSTRSAKNICLISTPKHRSLFVSETSTISNQMVTGSSESSAVSNPATGDFSKEDISPEMTTLNNYNNNNIKTVVNVKDIDDFKKGNITDIDVDFKKVDDIPISCDNVIFNDLKDSENKRILPDKNLVMETKHVDDKSSEKMFVSVSNIEDTHSTEHLEDEIMTTDTTLRTGRKRRKASKRKMKDEFTKIVDKTKPSDMVNTINKETEGHNQHQNILKGRNKKVTVPKFCPNDDETESKKIFKPIIVTQKSTGFLLSGQDLTDNLTKGQSSKTKGKQGLSKSSDVNDEKPTTSDIFDDMFQCLSRPISPFDLLQVHNPISPLPPSPAITTEEWMDSELAGFDDANVDDTAVIDEMDRSNITLPSSLPKTKDLDKLSVETADGSHPPTDKIADDANVKNVTKTSISNTENTLQTTDNELTCNSEVKNKNLPQISQEDEEVENINADVKSEQSETNKSRPQKNKKQTILISTTEMKNMSLKKIIKRKSTEVDDTGLNKILKPEPFESVTGNSSNLGDTLPSVQQMSVISPETKQSMKNDLETLMSAGQPEIMTFLHKYFPNNSSYSSSWHHLVLVIHQVLKNINTEMVYNCSQGDNSFNTPLMLDCEHHLIQLLQHISSKFPMCNLHFFLDILWTSAIIESDDVCSTASICRVYTAICRLNGDLEQARVLIYQIVYSTKNRSNLVLRLLAIVGVWPLILDRDFPKNSIMPSVIEHVVVKYSGQYKQNQPQIFAKFCQLCGWSCDLPANNNKKLLSNLIQLLKDHEKHPDKVYEIMAGLKLLLQKEDWLFLYTDFINVHISSGCQKWCYSKTTPWGIDPVYLVSILKVLGDVLVPENSEYFKIKNQNIQSLLTTFLIPTLLKQTPVTIVPDCAVDVIMKLSPYAPQFSMTNLYRWYKKIKAVIPQQIKLRLQQTRHHLLEHLPKFQCAEFV
ncbi:uncharacterized protein LOC126830018 [Patella vulgata]|uniref:uncharacterized protein LOC126830018 n=1 Tax=Patella vulgata TaxID=6465 RepID=UPI00217FD18A|nr:uncharacterized protein LOC126830018 [Patella vulgata]